MAQGEIDVLSASTRVVVVGGGKMGEAVLAGWLAAKTGPAAQLGPENFVVANPGQAKRDRLAQVYGVSCVADACEASGADIVVLSVKPQVMMGVVETLRNCPAYASANALYVSVAAGISTQSLEAALPQGSRVVRCMPNTPLTIGQGATGVCAGASASQSDVDLVRDLFASMGVAVVVDEADMDAVCAVSGSGPAYVDLFIETLRDAGAAQGLKPELAEQLAIQTVIGAARLLVESGQSPEEARLAVCSPGGTTLAALDAMTDGFTEALASGVAAAARRSKELGA